MVVTITMTVLAKLVASEIDGFGYTVYVFECLEDYMISQTKYIMCIRFPNWDHKSVELGEIGYLQYKEIQAGIDKWYDGKDMIPYNYDTIQFIKFIDKPNTLDKEYIM